MIERQFRITIERHEMLRPGDLVLVALSGGPDSTALLALLRGLAPEMRLGLHVAHLDHGWRGSGSAKDAEFVRRMALRYGLPVTVGRVQPSAWSGQDRKQSSREAKAREIRRNFLLETARQIGARRVALGHTRDDQAESFLLRLLRGSGARGLAGTFPVVDGILIRPLIELRRQDLVAYLKENRLRYRRDPTNSDTSLTRNRIRHKLLPLLEKQFNPAVVDALAQAAELLRDEDAHLDGVAEAEYRARSSARGNGVAFRAAALLELPIALRRRVLRLALAAVHGDLRRIEMGHVEQSLRLLEPPRGRRSVSLPDGLVVALRGDELLVRSRESGPIPVAGDGSAPREALCPVPGEVPLLGDVNAVVEQNKRRVYRSISRGRIDKINLQNPAYLVMIMPISNLVYGIRNDMVRWNKSRGNNPLRPVASVVCPTHPFVYICPDRDRLVRKKVRLIRIKP